VLDPVGPLPASVYWRRRVAALAAGIVVLLLIWAVLPGGGGDDKQPRDSAAAAGTPGATDPAAAPTGLSATAPSDDPGPAGDGNGVGGGSPVTPSPSLSASPTPSPTPVPTKAPTAAPPTTCPDTAIAVAVTPRAKAYKVGQDPVFDLRVRNISKVSCIRDLGAGQQEMAVYRGSQRLWSSNDCYPSKEKSPQLLRPGVQETSSVTWSGLGSRPNCAGKRAEVGAGSYTVVARVGTAVTRRTPFALR
jgi:hypothetical protein